MTDKKKEPGTAIELRAGEIQAAAMLAEGATFEEAAKALELSPVTIRGWYKNNQAFKEEVLSRAKESADRLQLLATHARLDIMEVAVNVGPTLQEAVQALNAKGEPDWKTRLKAMELALQHGLFDKADGKGDRANAQAAVLVITSDDVATAKRLTGDVDFIEAEVIEKTDDSN